MRALLSYRWFTRTAVSHSYHDGAPMCTAAMRYLHVISSLNPETGGPAEGVLRLTEASLSQGHEVEIATLDPPEAAWHLGLPCPVHALGPTRLGAFSYAARLLPWLTQNITDHEAVIVHGLWQYHGLAVRRAARQAGTPYFVFPHGMLDPWFRRTYPLKHMKKQAYWPWAEFRVLRDARAVLFTCEQERLLAARTFAPYRAREAIAPFGSPLPTGDASRQRDAFLAAWPELAGRRILLFLGRIHLKKGCDLLIEAFAKVSAQHPELHLVMAGPDQSNWRSELQRRADALGVRRLTWTGMLAGDLKWGALRAADAFVLPSHQENFGVAVTEALSCGLPVLISREVNIWREIDAANAGLVAADTLPGTVDLLQRWLELDQPARQRMSSNAMQLFLDSFQIDAAARVLVRVMHDHVGSSGSPAMPQRGIEAA
jgi:glycosyltransferase involved in cell wall biosynthesis